MEARFHWHPFGRSHDDCVRHLFRDERADRIFIANIEGDGIRVAMTKCRSYYLPLCCRGEFVRNGASEQPRRADQRNLEACPPSHAAFADTTV